MSALQPIKSSAPNQQSHSSAEQYYEQWRQSTQNQEGFRSQPVSRAGHDQHIVEISSWLQVPEIIFVQICALERTIIPKFPFISDEVKAEQDEIRAYFRDIGKATLDIASLAGKIESCILYRQGAIPGFGGTIRSGDDWIRASAPSAFEARLSVFRAETSERPARRAYAPIHKARPSTATVSVPCVERTLSTKTFSETEILAMPPIGEGGEGVVRRSSDSSACKIWHDSSPTQGNNAVAAGSCAHQSPNKISSAIDYEKRLKKLPIWVDDQLVLPTAFIRIPERGEDLSGFEMPYLGAGTSFGDLRNVGKKKKNNISQVDVAKSFVALYDLLWELQQMGVVVGDLKFQNVLMMPDGSVSIIDVDSLGVEGSQCRAYSRGYVDPRLCDPKENLEQLIKPHDAESVWYSYMVMLFEALSGIHPFTDGTHRPTGGEAGVSEDHRVMKGLSVFHPDVRLNKKFQDAISALPDDLREAFKEIFEDGARGRPRRSLITQLIPSHEIASKPYAPQKRSPWRLFPPKAGANIGELRGIARIGKVRCPQGSALIGKVIGAEIQLLTDVDLQQAERKIAPGSSAASRTSVLKPLDFSSSFTIYQDRSPAITKNLDAGTRRVWIDDRNLLTTAAVGVSPFGRTNIAAQRDQAIWIPPQSGRVVLSKGGKSKMIELPGDLSLFSGENFGIIVSTEGRELLDVFLVSDGVKRISGLPPILGPISDVECAFSDNFVWVFVTTTPEELPSRYILTLDASGKLRGLGAVPECRGAWHSAHVLRSAYDIGASRKPGLAAVVNGELVRLTCKNFQIVQDCRQRLIEGDLPRVLLATENDARGIWLRG